MIRTGEAVLDADGRVRLPEAVAVSGPRRVLLTVPEDRLWSPRMRPLLSEAVLANWDRPKQDAAWSHLQPAK